MAEYLIERLDDEGQPTRQYYCCVNHPSRKAMGEPFTVIRNFADVFYRRKAAQTVITEHGLTRVRVLNVEDLTRGG